MAVSVKAGSKLDMVTFKCHRPSSLCECLVHVKPLAAARFTRRDVQYGPDASSPTAPSSSELSPKPAAAPPLALALALLRRARRCRRRPSRRGDEVEPLAEEPPESDSSPLRATALVLASALFLSHSA